MFKSNLLVLVILVTCAGNCAKAQGQKKASAGGDQPIKFETLVSDYHFPVKQNTGNPEKDQQVYKEAKGKWISQNRELYRRYHAQFTVSNPEPRKASKPTFGESEAPRLNTNPEPKSVMQPSFTQSK